MYKIFHNPRCSKSRQTLQILNDSGVSPDIILYLEAELSVEDIKHLIAKLGFSSARQLMRRGESLYKELGLKGVEDEEVLIRTMAENPKLIERPIVEKGDKAIIGRPPENVLTLL